MKEKIYILLVDDDDVDGLALNRYVHDNRLPYQCAQVFSLEEARKYLKDNSPDLVILDYLLPDGTGLELIPELKELGIPTIVATGEGDEYVAAQAVKLGVHDYLVKDTERNYLHLLPAIITGALGKADTENTLKNASAELFKAQKEILKHSTASREFLSKVSHEIRTPMHAVMGLIQILEDTEMHKGQKETFLSLKSSAMDLMNLLNDLFDFTRLKDGELQLKRETFRIQDLNNQIVKQYLAQVHAQGLKLAIEITIPNEIEFVGDAGRIQQILKNLISNAVKFTHDGGITLRLGYEQKSTNMGMLKVEVEDSGIGMSKSQLKAVFTPFAQADNTLTRKAGGTGLGLSIVKQLTELMNGSLHIKSKPHRGTLVSLEIPLEIHRLKENEISVKHTKGNVFNDASKIKVLVAEDNAMNQLVARKFLENLNIKVDIASNGKQALDYLRKQDYDILILDLQMPELDGFQTAKFIRSRMSGQKQRIPILAMTAHAVAGEQERCFQVGMDDFIEKPVLFPELKNKIGQLLSLKRKAN